MRRESIAADMGRMRGDKVGGVDSIFAGLKSGDTGIAGKNSEDTSEERSEDLQGTLSQLLETFCNFRPAVGYCQGMSYLAAVFLLYMEPPAAFLSLANLMNRKFFRSFITMDLPDIRFRFGIFDAIFERNLPVLFARFTAVGVLTDLYLMEWCITLFSKQLPIPVASRVWDGYFLHGEVFVWKTAVSILKLLHNILLELDVTECMAALRHTLSEDIMREDALMAAIQQVVLPSKVQKYYEERNIRQMKSSSRMRAQKKDTLREKERMEQAKAQVSISDGTSA
jgi:hypothetical protein